MALLAEQVKQLVRGVAVDPFEGPHIEQKIENLFVQAMPGAIGKRPAKPRPTAHQIDTSMKFLDRVYTPAPSPSSASGSGGLGTSTESPKGQAETGRETLLRLLRARLEQSKGPNSASKAPTGDQAGDKRPRTEEPTSDETPKNAGENKSSVD